MVVASTITFCSSAIVVISYSYELNIQSTVKYI